MGPCPTGAGAVSRHSLRDYAYASRSCSINNAVVKVPQALQQSRDMAERLKILEKKLAKAVEDENFEQAALLRDEIKQMWSKRGKVATS